MLGIDEAVAMGRDGRIFFEQQVTVSGTCEGGVPRCEVANLGLSEREVEIKVRRDDLEEDSKRSDSKGFRCNMSSYYKWCFHITSRFYWAVAGLVILQIFVANKGQLKRQSRRLHFQAL